MKEIEFYVDGRPRGKERPRHAQMPNGKIITYTPKATKDYEAEIRKAFIYSGGVSFPDDVPLMVEATALMPIPKSASKAKAAEMESGAVTPVCKPDVDNIGKIALDALNGLAWTDDKQVTALIVRKKYDRRGGIGRLNIRITDISA